MNCSREIFHCEVWINVYKCFIVEFCWLSPYLSSSGSHSPAGPCLHGRLVELHCGPPLPGYCCTGSVVPPHQRHLTIDIAARPALQTPRLQPRTTRPAATKAPSSIVDSSIFFDVVVVSHHKIKVSKLQETGQVGLSLPIQLFISRIQRRNITLSLFLTQDMIIN